MKEKTLFYNVSIGMELKIKIKLLFILILCILLFPGVVLAQTPKLPLIFEGDVTIDGYDAPVGTVIVAEVDGVEASTNASKGGITGAGKYMLVIQNEGYTDKIVVFKVDGIVAGEHVYVSSMELIVNYDLHAQTNAPAGDIDDADVDNSITGKAGAFLSGLFGLGTKAIVGIVVGIVALVTVIVLMKIIRRRRYYI